MGLGFQGFGFVFVGQAKDEEAEEFGVGDFGEHFGADFFVIRDGFGDIEGKDQTEGGGVCRDAPPE